MKTFWTVNEDGTASERPMSEWRLSYRDLVRLPSGEEVEVFEIDLVRGKFRGCRPGGYVSGNSAHLASCGWHPIACANLV